MKILPALVYSVQYTALPFYPPDLDSLARASAACARDLCSHPAEKMDLDEVGHSAWDPGSLQVLFHSPPLPPFLSKQEVSGLSYEHQKPQVT